jgi:hypothetical protein
VAGGRKETGPAMLSPAHPEPLDRLFDCSSLPPRPGRQTHRAQVKALGPQLLEDRPEPEEPVSTFTAVNPRTALAEPHSGQRGDKPSE